MQHLGIAHQDVLCDEGVHWRRETQIAPGLEVFVEARQVGGLHCQVKLLLQGLPAGYVRSPGILNKYNSAWYSCADSSAVHRGSTAERPTGLLASVSEAAAELSAPEQAPPEVLRTGHWCWGEERQAWGTERMKGGDGPL